MVFSNAAYNIDGIPENELVIERFPDLMSQAQIFARETDLPKGVDADKVMRYLIYMFGPNGDFRKEFPDILKRKQAALLKLKITADETLNEDEDSEFSGHVTDGYGQMCLMNEPWIIERFIAFTRLHSSENYTAMSMAEIQIAAMQRGLLSTNASKAADYKAYQEGFEKWRETLEKARHRIMLEEDSMVLQRSITFSVRSENIGIEPENYTRVWMEKKEIFPEIVP